MTIIEGGRMYVHVHAEEWDQGRNTFQLLTETEPNRLTNKVFSLWKFKISYFSNI